MNFGLEQEDIESIRGVLIKNPEVNEIIIYGSRAKGNYKLGSDIDITLKGNLSLSDIWDLGFGSKT